MQTEYCKLLKDPRWQKKRLKVMERDSFKCRFCNDDKTTLNIHHLKYTKKPFDIDEKYLITVCEDCHYCIEAGKKINISVKSVDKIKNHNFTMLFATDGNSLIINYKDDNNNVLLPFGTNIMAGIKRLMERASNG